jgi:hypothetical protein
MLTLLDLWLRYSALGGRRTIVEVEAMLHGGLLPDRRDDGLLAAALTQLCPRGASSRRRDGGLSLVR